LSACAIVLTGCKRDREFPTALGEFASYGSVRTKWTQPQTLVAEASPVVVDDVVVFATGDRRLIARDIRDGRARWSSRLSSSIDSEIVWGQNLVAERGVVVACLVRGVIGVDIVTGRELWLYEPPIDSLYPATPLGPGTTAASALATDDVSVYVPAWGASLSRVDVLTGRPLWVWRPRSTGLRQGAVGVRLSDTVLVSGWSLLNRSGGQAVIWVKGLHRSDGRELWEVRFPVDAPGAVVRGNLALWRDLVLLGSAGGRTRAINRFTQQLVWDRLSPDLTNDTNAGPVIYGDFVYVDGGDQHAYALRAEDGSIIWKTFMGAQFETFLVTARRVYVVNGAYLGILERSTGRFVARLKQPGKGEFDESLFASPLVARGTQIFAAVLDGAWSFEEP
jgi:outer membrane protein assembly factor BamB